MKIMLALLTSVSLVAGSATAGELTVTGSAKATYNILSGGSNGASVGKGMGITNEIDFGAKGELDNGMSWNYQVQFDPAAGTGTGVVDDTRLELTTTYGTLGIYVLEGGLDVDNAASQSVYGRPTDIGLASGISDGTGIDGFNNLQIHTPADLLPYGISLKAAYAPGAQKTMNAANAASVDPTINGNAAQLFTGTSVEQYQIKANPVDGFDVGADYYKVSGQGNTTEVVVQAEESGSIFATYKIGAASLGVSRTLKAPLILATSATVSAISNTGTGEGNTAAARQITNNKMSVAYNVNDNLSLSYEVEKSERELITNAAEYDIEADAVQAAYTMGGMTLSVSHGTTNNVGYTQNNDSTQTLFAMAMADRKSVV